MEIKKTGVCMPAIKHIQLAVTTDRPLDRAGVVVNCDLEFTEVEVNAMNVLGLQYELSCRVLDKHLLDEDPVVTYHPQQFPIVPGAALRYEHAVFDTVTEMGQMHQRVLGKDQLVAELRLKNTETGTEDVKRSDVIGMDLAA